jgi:hypothetical protein
MFKRILENLDKNLTEIIEARNNFEKMLKVPPPLNEEYLHWGDFFIDGSAIRAKLAKNPKGFKLDGVEVTGEKIGKNIFNEKFELYYGREKQATKEFIVNMMEGLKKFFVDDYPYKYWENRGLDLHCCAVSDGYRDTIIQEIDNQKRLFEEAGYFDYIAENAGPTWDPESE